MQACYRVWGVNAKLSASDPGLWEELLKIVPPDWSSVTDPVPPIHFRVESRSVGGFQLLFNDSLIPCASWLPGVLEELRGRIHIEVAQRVRIACFVHAGVVGIGHGALVIPGPTFHGKSSLVRSLVAAGARFFSDEFAVITPDGLVHSYPRAMSIRTENGRKEYYSAADLGWEPGQGPLPLRWIAAIRYLEGSDWDCRALSKAQGFLTLYENSVAGTTAPIETFRILTSAVKSCSVIQGTRGDVREAVPALQKWIDQENYARSLAGSGTTTLNPKT